jgi:hypothetical protein
MRRHRRQAAAAAATGGAQTEATNAAQVPGFELENLVAGIVAALKGFPDAAAGTFHGGTTFLAHGVAGLGGPARADRSGAASAPARVGRRGAAPRQAMQSVQGFSEMERASPRARGRSSCPKPARLCWLPSRSALGTSPRTTHSPQARGQSGREGDCADPFTTARSLSRVGGRKVPANRHLLTEALEHTFAGMCSRKASLQRCWAAAFSLQIEQSRRPDSNRGPLHYE